MGSTHEVISTSIAPIRYTYKAIRGIIMKNVVDATIKKIRSNLL